MYPDLLSGELGEVEQPSVVRREPVYPSLVGSSVDELEKFLDSDPEPVEVNPPIQTKYPANIQGFSDASFRCLWCEKTLFGEEQLEGHLQGKEHRKRCLNCDIVPYGMPEHFEQIEEYVSSYGNNLYARLRHWPAFIGESKFDWSCDLCNKRFQTQAMVTQHLSDVNHSSTGMEIVRNPSPPTAGGKSSSSPTYSPKVERREQRMERGEKRARPGLVRVPSPVRALAEEKERIARMSAMMDFEAMHCPICQLSFGSLKATEEHVESLRHAASYLEFGIKNKSYLI